MSLKTATPFALVGLLVMTMLGSGPGAVLAADAAAAGQIATVDGTAVLRQDLDREMQLVSMKLTRQGRPMSPEQLKRYENEFRETLINRRLLLQHAHAEGITIKESLVAKALAEFKDGFKDEQAYRQALTQMGFTEKVLEDQIRDGLAVKALLDKDVLNKISISDEQVRAYYDDNPNRFRQPEQVRASHILIQVPADADEAKKSEALKKIQGIQKRIADGENFADLAMKYSEGPSKAKGGDLGFFSREQMVQPFSEAAFALQPGQVSDVVTTRFGYHLIRVTERKPEQDIPFKDVSEAISARLRQEEEQKQIQAYLQDLRKDADIKRFPL